MNKKDTSSIKKQNSKSLALVGECAAWFELLESITLFNRRRKATFSDLAKELRRHEAKLVTALHLCDL